MYCSWLPSGNRMDKTCQFPRHTRCLRYHPLTITIDLNGCCQINLPNSLCQGPRLFPINHVALTWNIQVSSEKEFLCLWMQHEIGNYSRNFTPQTFLCTSQFHFVRINCEYNYAQGWQIALIIWTKIPRDMHEPLRTHSCCSITLTMQWQQWMLAVQWTISHCRMHTGLCREKQNSIEGVGKQMHAIDSKAVQSKQHGKIVQYSGQLGCQLAQRIFELGECQSTTNISSNWWYAIICKCTWASLWT